MPLRIAFDLDGVLADMESELVRQAEILFGKPMTRQLRGPAEARRPQPDPPSTAGTGAGDPDESTTPATDDSGGSTPADESASATPVIRLTLTARQARRLWRHVASIENFWELLQEIEEGAVARLAALAADRRWEVIFLTRRPPSAGAPAQLQSQRWLESKGFALPSVYVVQGSRGRIAAALDLDVVVDDRLENCLDVVGDSKARSILISRHEEALPATAQQLGIAVVKSVADCLDVLATVDSAAVLEPGLLDRVKRLLGLKKETADV